MIDAILAFDYALLVEPDGDKPEGKLRVVKVRLPAPPFIIERLHLDPRDPSKVHVRTWINKNEERALTGQPVYREELPPPPKEEPEKPIFDELKIKEPLKFGVDRETFGKMAKKYGKK